MLETTTTAMLFPGQGSQTDDMRETVARERPDLLALVEDEVGEDPFARVRDGTRYAQPAIFCASVAGWEGLGRPDVDVVAGHSLGEFAALVAARSLSDEDGLRLVALRGRLMDEAARNDGDGGMLAVLGRHEGSAPRIAERHGLTVANDNAPTEMVLSGNREDLGAAAADIRRDERLRAMRLAVGGAFHSPAMKPAEPEFRAALDEVEFHPPEVTAVSSVTARPFDDIRRRLLEGLTRPVRWRETVSALHELGARRFVEAGPGRVLSKLVPRSLADAESVAAEDLEPAHV